MQNHILDWSPGRCTTTAFNTVDVQLSSNMRTVTGPPRLSARPWLPVLRDIILPSIHWQHPNLIVWLTSYSSSRELNNNLIILMNDLVIILQATFHVTNLSVLVIVQLSWTFTVLCYVIPSGADYSDGNECYHLIIIIIIIIIIISKLI